MRSLAGARICAEHFVIEKWGYLTVRQASSEEAFWVAKVRPQRKERVRARSLEKDTLHKPCLNSKSNVKGHLLHMHKTDTKQGSMS